MWVTSNTALHTILGLIPRLSCVEPENEAINNFVWIYRSYSIHLCAVYIFWRLTLAIITIWVYLMQIVVLCVLNYGTSIIDWKVCELMIANVLCIASGKCNMDMCKVCFQLILYYLKGNSRKNKKYLRRLFGHGSRFSKDVSKLVPDWLCGYWISCWYCSIVLLEIRFGLRKIWNMMLLTCSSTCSEITRKMLYDNIVCCGVSDQLISKWLNIYRTLISDENFVRDIANHLFQELKTEQVLAIKTLVFIYRSVEFFFVL